MGERGGKKSRNQTSEEQKISSFTASTIRFTHSTAQAIAAFGSFELKMLRDRI